MANTEYVTLEKEDYARLIYHIQKVLCYFSELSISKKAEDKLVVRNWFHSSDSRFKRNKLNKFNSPCSYLSGTLNNILFNKQRDFTKSQLNIIETIVNEAHLLQTELVAELQDEQIEPIEIRENLWL